MKEMPRNLPPAPSPALGIALYQPDIAQNTGTIARLCAGLGIPLTIIEPAGFAWTDSGLRRAAMDYLKLVELERAASWQDFMATNQNKRIILVTTKAKFNYLDFDFRPGDTLLFGRESSGVPESVRAAIPDHISIAMTPRARSLNVALAAAMVAGEALRQLQANKVTVNPNARPD